MKVLEFIYQDSVIHFAMNPGEKNVMVNATEMAKAFGKRIDHFLRSKDTIAFLNAIKFPPNGGNLGVNPDQEMVVTKGRGGTYMHRVLALKFAAWLDPAFEVWVFTKIEDLVFGNYKRHWEAHALEEKAKEEMSRIKPLLLSNPTSDLVQEYFQAESSVKEAKKMKRRAIQNQLNLFNQADDQ